MSKIHRTWDMRINKNLAQTTNEVCLNTRCNIKEERQIVEETTARYTTCTFSID